MSILTSWTFWLILGAIIIIMALIGYLAEGTEFANKALAKQPKQKKAKEPKDKPVPEVVPVETKIDNVEPIGSVPSIDEAVVVSADKPIEVLNVGSQTPDAWADVIPKVDNRLETAYTVPSVDDWSVIPETGNELPEVKLDSLETTEENSNVQNQIDNDIFPDITQDNLEQIASSESPVEQAPSEVPTVNDVVDTIPETPAEVPEEIATTKNKDVEDIWK